uniref:Big defensin-like n=1 Tax=Crassostrea virginica TaxID=6565 RepID=A0A8B8CFP4_CRAVI|nr:big defensin-like [Crassostrea virginica]
MEKKYVLCVFFVVFLVSPAPILAEALEKERETENKRQAQALFPLRYYAGMTVPTSLFFALVAAYGIHAVTRYYISRAGKDSRSCDNNRGWCRAKCLPHEYYNNYHSDICGSYCCCKPK